MENISPINVLQLLMNEYSIKTYKSPINSELVSTLYSCLNTTGISVDTLKKGHKLFKIQLSCALIQIKLIAIYVKNLHLLSVHGVKQIFVLTIFISNITFVIHVYILNKKFILVVNFLYIIFPSL